MILDRSFDFRRTDEIVYYYCISRGLGYEEASEILKKSENIPHKDNDYTDIMYTGELKKLVDDCENEDELLDFISENYHQFTVSNFTACKKIQKMWPGIVKTVINEDEFLNTLYTLDEDRDMSPYYAVKNHKEISNEDVILYIMGLTQGDIKGRGADRSLKPVVEALGPVVSRNFPDRLTLSQILTGKNVSYEKARKMLILLTFYKVQAEAFIAHDYNDNPDIGKRADLTIDQELLSCGYDCLYAGNPYDWIFLYADSQFRGLDVFRDIIGDLTELADAVADTD